jgi:hypothetical protein
MALRKRALATALAAAFVGGAAIAATLNPNARSGPPAPSGPVAVRATPIAHFDPADPTRTRFGRLMFRGGLVLSSPSRWFGGWSGLRLEADGRRLVAVSDHGTWLTGRIAYDGSRPVGLADAAMAALRDDRGAPLPPSQRDTESLEVSGTTAWVGAEGTNRIWRFDLDHGIAAARGRPIAVPAKMRRGVPSNGGFEALGRVPAGHPHAGALIVITESELDAAGNHVAWILDHGRARRFAVKMRDGYAVSDMTFLPDGDIALLERRYRAPFSLWMQVRLLKTVDIAPGAVVDGPVLMAASLAKEIDNMEGISAFRAPDGATVLTLMSDDNFNPLERTLLLQFAIAE